MSTDCRSLASFLIKTKVIKCLDVAIVKQMRKGHVLRKCICYNFAASYIYTTYTDMVHQPPFFDRGRDALYHIYYPELRVTKESSALHNACTDYY